MFTEEKKMNDFVFKIGISSKEQEESLESFYMNLVGGEQHE